MCVSIYWFLSVNSIHNGICIKIRICIYISLYICCLVAKSCPTLCDPMDCSPPGSSVHGILQARILGGLPCPPPGDLPNPGIKPVSPALWVDSIPLSRWGSPSLYTDWLVLEDWLTELQGLPRQFSGGGAGWTSRAQAEASVYRQCYRGQAHSACCTTGQWTQWTGCWSKEYDCIQKASWPGRWQTNDLPE